MSTSLFSSSWYQVSDIRFRLRNHAEIHRHIYRGQLWYVLQDRVSGQFHRFTPEAYQIIGKLDGGHTLQNVWEAACEILDEDMPTQDELISLISKLYRANILKSDVAPNIEDLRSRHKSIIRKKFFQKIKSPLGIRIPLFDPDAFLDRTKHFIDPIFSTVGLFLWLSLIIYALLMAGINWQSLSTNISDQVLGLQNLILIGLIYPVVKLIHEFGHAYALKRWGAEVHEMGIMFLVFFPVPYVEASEAISFPNKNHRMVVGAIGIIVESFLAAVAMLVWMYAEPGIVRSIAFNVMVISGVSTLLFNGNPLLKFDAYFVLADFLEMPNLGARSNQYVGYLIKKKLLRVKELDSPATSFKEGCWLLSYSISSFFYRFFVMLAIALFVASEYFFLGVLVAIWSIYLSFIQPLLKILAMPMTDEQLKPKKIKAYLIGISFVGALVMLLGVVPFPYSTTTHAVFQPTEKDFVRANVEGFITKLVATPGSKVDKGDLLIITEARELLAEAAILKAQVNEAEARYQANLDDTNRSEIIRKEIEYLKEEYEGKLDRESSLEILSEQSGIFNLADSEPLIGRYVGRGQLLAYVVDYNNMLAITLVNEDSINKVVNNTHAIEVKLSSASEHSYAASIKRVTPSSSFDLPSPVLTLDGGGLIAADPRQSQKLQAFNRHFFIELEINEASNKFLEERVYVVFKHDPEPLFYRWYRDVRRVFLRQLDV